MKDTIDESDNKCDRDDTPHELAIKLEKATLELSKVREEKNYLLVDLKNITNKMSDETEHDLEIQPYKDEVKKKELLKESK